MSSRTFCFEPGATKRLFSENRVSQEVCSTLRAKMGDNLPAIILLKEIREEHDESVED